MAEDPKVVDKLNRLAQSHGAIEFGKGLASAVIALILAVSCLPGVLVFHFPAYLGTPELRQSYDVELMRKVLLAAMLMAGGMSLANILFNRQRWLSAIAFGLIVICALPGGAVPHRAGGGPGAVLGAPRLPRGVRAVTPARRASQRRTHGLAGRIAPAHLRTAAHPHPGAGAHLCAGLLQGSDRRLHRHRRLPGRVQPRRRQRAARTALRPDRHAQLPTGTIRRTRRRWTATTPRISPSSITCSARR